MTDEEYRQKLIRHGVSPAIIKGLSSHDLGCVGNACLAAWMDGAEMILIRTAL